MSDAASNGEVSHDGITDILASPDQVHSKFTPQHAVHALNRKPLSQSLFPHCAHLLPITESLESEECSATYIDIIPRPIMSTGEMVQLLTRCSVGHYIDFRPLDTLFVQFYPHEGGLQQVPGSRAEVFTNNFVSVLEKRLLMRFVRTCFEKRHHDFVTTSTLGLSARAEKEELEHAEEAEDDHTSFEDYMSDMRLTERLKTFMTHSIAFSAGSEHVLRKEGVDAVYRYQTSIMRFGTRTPFLYPNHGTGELAQAFCRLCAVHGGTYVLRRSAAAVVVADRAEEEEALERNVGIVTTEGELVSASHVFIPKPSSVEVGFDVWRIACVLDGSVLNGVERGMITVPRGVVGNGSSAVRLRQLDASVMTCRLGRYLLYAETFEKGGTEDDVLNAVSAYVRMGPGDEDKSQGDTEQHESDAMADIKPRMLWGVCYKRGSLADEDGDGADAFVNGNGVVYVGEREDGIDADGAIAEAERCFSIARPGAEFFPERTDQTMNSHEESFEEDTEQDIATMENGTLAEEGSIEST